MNETNVIVLCPDFNLAGLRTTCLSIKRELGDISFFTMVGENASDRDIADLEKFSKVYRGGKTITSLFDVGMAKATTEWCFFIVSGSWIKESIFLKYLYFRREEKDVLFPVVDRKVWFDEASINGIMVHRNAFRDAGAIGDDEESLEKAKLVWAAKAIEKGYRFKALVGAKIF